MLLIYTCKNSLSPDPGNWAGLPKGEDGVEGIFVRGDLVRRTRHRQWQRESRAPKPLNLGPLPCGLVWDGTHCRPAA